MRFYKLLPLLAALMLASACGSSRYTSAGVDIKSVDEFAFFQPYALVIGYDAKNNPYYSGVDSKFESSVISGIVDSERFPFTQTIPVDYYDDKTEDLKWVSHFPEIDPKKIDRLRVPKTFIKMLEESGHRYGVIISAKGFIRSQEALEREAALRSVSKILDKVIENTTGVYNATNYNTVSAPYGNDMYLAVIDGETASVVHFVKHVSAFYSHPTNRSDINTLVHKVLQDFTR